MTDLLTGLRKTFSLKSNLCDIMSLKPITKILMAIMLIAEGSVFICGKNYSFMGWIGLFTGIATVMNLILVDQGRLTNYSWGILSCAVWLIVAFNNHLIGDICSQTFYLVMQFLGISIWHRNMKHQTDSTEIKPKKMSWQKEILVIVGIISMYFVVLATSKALHGTQIYLDATLLPLGIAGQFLMTYGYKFQWVIWIIDDIVNCTIWFIQLARGGAGAITMFMLQVIMLFNAFYGMYYWFKKAKVTETLS
ncbi:nicotinamide riboside transporter PnuC [Ligilactobacillus sp. LYQ139]|uniref:nicotinamide riboside transporter PnuC n=1 Tax=Ligilactobacillus sp. LYQ139 TaxID=3378800 RepID=UPI0038542707